MKESTISKQVLDLLMTFVWTLLDEASVVMIRRLGLRRVHVLRDMSASSVNLVPQVTSVARPTVAPLLDVYLVNVTDTGTSVIQKVVCFNACVRYGACNCSIK